MYLAKKNCKVFSSIFGFQQNVTLVPYCPEHNKKPLVVLSSMRHDKEISNGKKNKQTII